jgi:ABC-type polysaccharide/polyol phosphate export permease
LANTVYSYFYRHPWLGQPLREMLPHLAVSIIVWQFLSAIIIDSINIFPSSSGILLNQRVACSTIVISSVYKNILIFLHNLLIIPLVYLIFQYPISFKIFLVIPAAVMVGITAFWVSYVIGALCARYRDLGSALTALMQLIFYITPVIWKPGFIGEEHQWLIHINPFAHYLAVLRDPILGGHIALVNWLVVIFITFAGLLLSLPFIGRYHRRLLFWI